MFALEKNWKLVAMLICMECDRLKGFVGIQKADSVSLSPVECSTALWDFSRLAPLIGRQISKIDNGENFYIILHKKRS